MLRGILTFNKRVIWLLIVLAEHDIYIKPLVVFKFKYIWYGQKIGIPCCRKMLVDLKLDGLKQIFKNQFWPLIMIGGRK
jgi:hypothetical protein